MIDGIVTIVYLAQFQVLAFEAAVRKVSTNQEGIGARMGLRAVKQHLTDLIFLGASGYYYTPIGLQYL